MGNCQAAEAAVVVIQRSGGTIQRIYYPVSANEVMASNPGHYVAVVTPSVTPSFQTGASVRHLKLLRPDDTLLIGHAYRLIRFEEVLKEFAGRRFAKLSRVAPAEKQRGEKEGREGPRPSPEKSAEMEMERGKEGLSRISNGSRAGVSRYPNRQWKPVLQSIAELGS